MLLPWISERWALVLDGAEVVAEVEAEADFVAEVVAEAAAEVVAEAETGRELEAEAEAEAELEEEDEELEEAPLLTPHHHPPGREVRSGGLVHRGQVAGGRGRVLLGVCQYFGIYQWAHG